MGFFWQTRRSSVANAAQVKPHQCAIRVTLAPDGPSQLFASEISEILVGRDANWASFVLPAADRQAGRRHMQLRRQVGGDWEVVRLADYYIEVNGRPVISQARLRDGDRITLGGKDGPTLRFELVPPDGPVGPDPEVTGFQPAVPPLEIALQRLKRNAAFVVAGLVAVVLATGHLWMTVDEHEARLETISTELAGREERALEQPSAWREASEKLQKATHLVLVRQNGVERGIATAWPITPTRMVTNAHVAAEIASRRDLEIIVRSPGATPRDFPVRAVTLHGGYEPFARYLKEHKAGAKTADGAFKQVKLPGAYDLAVLELAPGSNAGPVLELAAPGDAARVGDQIAFAGYFLRDIEGNENAHRFPTPRVHFGNVSAVTNFFLFPAEDAADAHLIHNTIPLTGGTSGGPVIDHEGRVVAIISSGTVVPLHAGPGGAAEDATKVPSAAMVNYAQDAGLVRDFLDGTSFDVEVERTGWRRELAKFDNHQQYVLNEFLGDIARRGDYVRMNDPVVRQVKRSLDANGMPIKLEAGHSYAVLAYSQGAGPIWLRVNAEGREIASDNADAARVVFDAEKSGDAELLLVTNSESPSSVELFVYRTE